jgi:hypothetical protein
MVPDVISVPPFKETPVPPAPPAVVPLPPMPPTLLPVLVTVTPPAVPAH